jgi:hypothetical protein
MQYVHEQTNKSGIRNGPYPVDRTEIERVVSEQTGARKAVIQVRIDALINGRSLRSRGIGGMMVSLR